MAGQLSDIIRVGEKIKIRVVPNAPRSECAGVYGDALKIKIAAPATDGKANAELVKFLSKALGVPKNAVSILCGDTSHNKLVEIEGTADCAEKLKLLAGE